jgi:hypothetical protein
MIVPEHSANYSLAPRSNRRAVQDPEKCDVFSRKNTLVTYFAISTILIQNNSCCTGLRRSFSIQFRDKCFLAIYKSIVLISRFDRFLRKQFPLNWKLQLNFLILGTASIKSNKDQLKLALTNPSVDIDIMDGCLAMYHKRFYVQCISFVRAPCLGRGRF